MQTVDFEKLENGKWYVVKDDYQGDFEDLEMVNGADLFLDLITTDDRTAKLTVSDEEPETGDYSTLRLIYHDEIGGTYQVENCEFYTKTIWLCNVAHLFFDGEHPETIYFQVIDA